MMDRPPNILTGYFPLWGATFDSKDLGVVGGSVGVMIPYADDWKRIFRSDAWKERFASVLEPLSDGLGPQIGPESPPCLMISSPMASDESFEEAVDRLKEQFVEEARHAVLALRLFKPGWFIDPELTECSFLQKPRIARLAGPFRQAFMERVPDELPSRYTIRIEELSLQKGVPSPTAGLWSLIEQYHHIAHHTTADIALENFNRSYGFQLRGTQRCALLFTALDAMLGGMNTDRIGRLKLQSPLRERVFAALDAVEGNWAGTNASPMELSQWINTVGRRIWQAVATGNATSVTEQADGSWEYIQLIVRVLLRQYLEFSVKWFKDPDSIKKRLGLQDDVAPVVGFNLALELKATKKARLDDLLSFDASS